MQCGAIITWSIVFEILIIETHSSPVSARYGVYVTAHTIFKSLTTTHSYQVCIVVTLHRDWADPVELYELKTSRWKLFLMQK